MATKSKLSPKYQAIAERIRANLAKSSAKLAINEYAQTADIRLESVVSSFERQASTLLDHFKNQADEILQRANDLLDEASQKHDTISAILVSIETLAESESNEATELARNERFIGEFRRLVESIGHDRDGAQHIIEKLGMFSRQLNPKTEGVSANGSDQ